MHALSASIRYHIFAGLSFCCTVYR
jgi:hypothetical protein